MPASITWSPFRTLCSMDSYCEDRQHQNWYFQYRKVERTIWLAFRTCKNAMAMSSYLFCNWICSRVSLWLLHSKCSSRDLASDSSTSHRSQEKGLLKQKQEEETCSVGAIAYNQLSIVHDDRFGFEITVFWPLNLLSGASAPLPWDF